MHTLIEDAVKDAKSKMTPPLSEEEEELHDALSPKYDQLKIQKAWWIIELIPLHLRYQRGDNQWVSYVAWVFSCQTLGFVLLTDHCVFVVGRTWLNLDSYQNSARMDSKCTEVSNYEWKPNLRMKSDAIKARNISPNLISKSSLRGLTNDYN